MGMEISEGTHVLTTKDIYMKAFRWILPKNSSAEIVSYNDITHEYTILVWHTATTEIVPKDYVREYTHY